MSIVRRLVLKSLLNHLLRDWHEAIVELKQADEIDERAYWEGVADGLSTVVQLIDHKATPAVPNNRYSVEYYDEVEPSYREDLVLSWSN